MTAGCSILAVTEDEEKCAEVYALLERDQRNRIRRISLDFQRVSEELRLAPADVVILFMPRLDAGVRTWIRHLIARSSVAVLASTNEQVTAREIGVEDRKFCTCPYDGCSAISIVSEINIKLRQMVQNQQQKPENRAPAPAPHGGNTVSRVFAGQITGTKYADPKKIIAIGASMGGVETVTKVLSVLPEKMPGIIVTQHMPEGFTAMFAKSLSDVCALRVEEATDGAEITPGKVIIARGGQHLTVVKGRNGGYMTKLLGGERVEGHIPSVTVMFESVAAAAGKDAMGVILTGMGGDGGNGMLKMFEAGAYTVGQDAETSLVYGMPRVAFELGAVSEQAPLDMIPRKMISYANR